MALDGRKGLLDMLADNALTRTPLATRGGLLGDVIWNNRNKQWVQRAMNPGGVHGGIRRPGGALATHMLAAEVDDQGRAWVFPTVVQQPDGTFKKFDDAFEALRFARSRGEAIPFPDIRTALEFTRSYKDDPLVKLKAQGRIPARRK